MTFTVVPINYLLRRTLFHGSFPLASGHPDLSETEVVKALRTHASHTLEVRMRLTPLPLLLPWHPLRPSDMAREKPPGRETQVGRKCAGGTGSRCGIVPRVGGRVPGGTRCRRT